MPKSTQPSKPNKQYAPWSEHEPEEEIPIMSKEEIARATAKIVEYMRKHKDA